MHQLALSDFIFNGGFRFVAADEERDLIEIDRARETVYSSGSQDKSGPGESINSGVFHNRWFYQGYGRFGNLKMNVLALRAQEFAFFFANLGQAVVGQALRLPAQE